MNPVQESLPQPQHLPEIEAPHEKLLRAPTLAEKMSQGKFKFILILIALFLVVDAGIYITLLSNTPKETYSKGNKTQVVVPPSSPTPTAVPTPIIFPTLSLQSITRWITYRYPEARLTLKYPFTYFSVKDPNKDGYELMFAQDRIQKQDLEKCLSPKSDEAECNRFALAINIETFSKAETQTLSEFVKQQDAKEKESNNTSRTYNSAQISGFPAFIYEGPGLGIGHFSYVDKGSVVVVISAFAFDEENMKAYKQILSTVQFADRPVVKQEGAMCGGIAAIQCSAGYTCKLDGDFPDAGGKCEKTTSLSPTSAPLPTRETEQVFCTQDIKVCSDGSYVSRTGPSCEFKACPATKSNKSMKPSVENEDDE